MDAARRRDRSARASSLDAGLDFWGDAIAGAPDVGAYQSP